MFTPGQTLLLAATRVCVCAHPTSATWLTSGDLLPGAAPDRRQTSSLGSHDLGSTKAASEPLTQTRRQYEQPQKSHALPAGVSECLLAKGSRTHLGFGSLHFYRTDRTR